MSCRQLAVLTLVGVLRLPQALAADAGGADPLAPARALLAKGDFLGVQDAVAAARGVKPVAGAEVLLEAGTQAYDQGDRWMAARYCAAALDFLPSHRGALTLCARAALTDERYEDAARYGEKLSKLAPRDVEVALLRARAALGEQQPARAKAILARVEGAEARTVTAQAEELTLRLEEEKARQKVLDERLAKAIAQAKVTGMPTWSRGSSQVVLYVTSWCGACKRAKAWLRQNKIEHTEKDLEADPEAARELAGKCALARVRPTGVPVLDARGRLLVGFGAASYRAALR
ncbi:MAG TPA: glutaredoxin family protein [Myxococcales bacterium]|jgi:glutaredoxin